MAKPGPDPSVTDEQIIRAIVTDRKPVRSTSEIAAAIDLTRQGTRKHLDRMQEAGLLNKDKAGPTVVWWPTTEGRELL